MADPVTLGLVAGSVAAGSAMAAKGGGGGAMPSPITRPSAKRIEPDLDAAKRRDDQLKRKQRSLATRTPLSEPLLKTEKLGT